LRRLLWNSWFLRHCVGSSTLLLSIRLCELILTHTHTNSNRLLINRVAVLPLRKLTDEKNRN
jgi:uncharacterized membrane protein (DUF2068 family)